MGPVRLREVEESQQRIVAIIRRLDESGEIIISRGGKMPLSSEDHCRPEQKGSIVTALLSQRKIT